MKKDWLIGFFEGEGNFSINAIETKEGTLRFQASININSTDLRTIQKIKNFMKVGNIAKKPKIYWTKLGINARDQYMYYISTISDIKKFFTIIPPHLFETNKRKQYDLFISAFKIIESTESFTRKGVLKLAKIRDKMGLIAKPKKYRDYNYFKQFLNINKEKYTNDSITKRKKKRKDGFSTKGKRKRRIKNKLYI